MPQCGAGGGLGDACPHAQPLWPTAGFDHEHAGARHGIGNAVTSIAFLLVAVGLVAAIASWRSHNSGFIGADRMQLTASQWSGIAQSESVNRASPGGWGLLRKNGSEAAAVLASRFQHSTCTWLRWFNVHRLGGQAPGMWLWHHRFCWVVHSSGIGLGKLVGQARMTVHSSQRRIAGRLDSRVRQQETGMELFKRRPGHSNGALARGVGAGLGFGAVIGLMAGTVALGMMVGVVLGAAIGAHRPGK